MTLQSVPPKRFRLHDGSMGTERQALEETLRDLEAKRLHLEEQIELTRLKLETAEG